MKNVIIVIGQQKIFYLGRLYVKIILVLIGQRPIGEDLLDIRKPLKYESWNSSRLQWAVDVKGTVDGEPGDAEWTCEIALPLEDVVTAPNIPPEPGDQWRVNLYRVENRPEKAGLAWSPTLKRDFHIPSMFGSIVFTDREVP